MLDTGNMLLRALADEGKIDAAASARVQAHAQRTGMGVSEAVSALGMVPAREVALTWARICEYPFVEIASYDVDIRNAALMPRSMAERWCAFPLFKLAGVVTVGMVDPLNLQAVDTLRQALRAEIEPVVCEREPLRALIARAYTLAAAGPRASDDSRAAAAELTTGEEPIVAAVNQIILGALAGGASDVHINPDDGVLHLRYRIDGHLKPQQGPGLESHSGLVQRLKVLARLDLTQTRKPQDGKFRFVHGEHRADVRVSIIPTVHGENAVLRLLRPTAIIAGVHDLQMPAAIEERFRQHVQRPHGMILVTGPTGSGKTTTLYAALAMLNSPSRNIVTIEDPVEIRMPMVRQVQVNPETGVTFASALRSILRQDPDVILVGEIRDEETAKIAVQSSLTGHLVLSTMHTNDAVGAIARLRDFGVPPFGINSALLCVVAQRLVRRVCTSCVKPDEHAPAAWRLLTGGDQPLPPGLVRGIGCPMCAGAGSRGRMGVFEMFSITPALQALIGRNSDAAAIRRLAADQGMRSMWDDGLEKAVRGLTSLDEIAPLFSRNMLEPEEGRLAA